MRTVLCWIDLETTGLDPTHDRILEAAVIITDPQLRPLAAPLGVTINRGPAILNLMCDKVRAMHAQTGLLSRVALSRVRAEIAYADIVRYIADGTQGTDVVYLAGNSVHFDREFLKRWIPTLDSVFHHRHIDVSTIRQCFAWWNLPTFTRMGIHHTAMDDITSAIAELAFYRKHCLSDGA